MSLHPDVDLILDLSTNFDTLALSEGVNLGHLFATHIARASSLMMMMPEEARKQVAAHAAYKFVSMVQDV